MKIKRFSAFGTPIIHSFSPQIYQQLFEKNNLNWKYNRILTNNPNDVIKFIKEFELYGANITAPLKKSVIPYLTSITDDSKQIEAVNTILNRDNKLLGFNTDWEGVMSGLQNYFLKKNEEYDLENKNILIIGAGNASSAAVYGIKIFFPKSYIEVIRRSDINSISLADYDIIIITIPNPEKYFSKIKFPKQAILFFANYTDVDYFKKLKQTNKQIIFGNEWLKEQAISAFEYYYGYDEYCKQVKLTQNRIAKEFNKLKEKTIFLTGFSGAGKTSIGEKIAKYLNRPFFDLDKVVEEYFVDNIVDIFKKRGENIFRECETKVLSMLMKEKKSVIALGGGTITESRNLKYIRKGFVIYLYSDLETSLSRINIASRPILSNKTKSEMEKLYLTRKFIYFDNSDIIIENADNSIDKIIEEIKFFV